MEEPLDFQRSLRAQRRHAEVRYGGTGLVRRTGRRGPGWREALVTTVLAGVLIGLAIPRTWLAGGQEGEAPDAGERIAFGLCHTGGGVNCVVDGDTFWMNGEKIRIADIDTPETHPSRCAEEQRLGDAATARLRALLSAGPVTLVTAGRDVDRYGRLLRVVERDGQSLGQVLVDEGLARPWEGRRRPWCGAADLS